jgi:glycosyltransferase involved in cell wall biosynthesis
MLESITPLILTFNEAPNIGRMLSKLTWAKDIVVVDSNSTDGTMELANKFPQVRTFQRKFNAHADQWNFGLKETGISTDWVLALDADYLLSDELVEELKGLDPADGVQGYRASFRYCIEGKPLRGSVYPPVTVLYRWDMASYKQDGHTQRIHIDGSIADLRAPICHDDRKPMSHWLQSQAKYMKLEAHKLLSSPFSQLGCVDRLRRLYIFAPLAIFFYCLTVKGTVLDGKAGLFYAFQRMLAESLLSLYLLEQSFHIARDKKRL